MPRFNSLAAVVLLVLAGSGLVSGQDCSPTSTYTTTVTSLSSVDPVVYSTTTTETVTSYTVITADGGASGTSTSWSVDYTVISSTTPYQPGTIITSGSARASPPATQTTWSSATSCAPVYKRQATPAALSSQPLESVVLYTCLASDNSTSPATATSPFVTGPNGPAGGAIFVTLADTTTLYTSTFPDGSLEIFTVEDKQIYTDGSIVQTQSLIGSSFSAIAPRTTASSTTFSDGSVEIVTNVEAGVWTGGKIVTSTSAIGTSFIPASPQTTIYTTTLGNGSVAVVEEVLRDFLGSSGALETSTSAVWTSIIPGSSVISSSSTSSLSASTSSGIASTVTYSTTGADGAPTPIGTLVVNAPSNGTTTTVITSTLDDGATEYIGERVFPISTDGTTTTVTEPLGTYYKDATTTIPSSVTSSWTTVLSTTLSDGTREYTTEVLYVDPSATGTSTIPIATLIINPQTVQSDTVTTEQTVSAGITSFVGEDIYTTTAADGSVSTGTSDIGTYIVAPSPSLSSPTPTPTSTAASSPSASSSTDCPIPTSTVYTTVADAPLTYTSTSTSTSTCTSSFTTTTYDNFVTTVSETTTITSTSYTATLSSESLLAPYTATVSVTTAWIPAATPSGYAVFENYQNIDFPYSDISYQGSYICTCDGTSTCFGTNMTCPPADAGAFESCANMCVKFNNLGVIDDSGSHTPCRGVVYEQGECFLKWEVPVGDPNTWPEWCGAFREYVTYSGILLNQTVTSYPGECEA